MRMITTEELEQRLASERPDNESKNSGYALVNVLPPEQFQKQHIPGSINIPRGSEDQFGRRFDRSKEIIAYCASPECPASGEAAEELRNRGFTNVFVYEGGMREWAEGGNRTERDTMTEMRMS